MCRKKGKNYVNENLNVKKGVRIVLEEYFEIKSVNVTL